MKRRFLILIIIVAVAGISFIVFDPFTKGSSDFRFDTTKVIRGSISSVVTATGTIEAITTINVGTQVSGIIKKVYVDFNDRVKKGQVLANLDETVLRDQLEQAQATLDQARAQFHYQDATFKRLKTLYENKLIAQADYDQALYNYENAKAAVSDARSSLERAKTNLSYATIYSPIDGVVLNRAVEAGQTVAASFNTPTLFTIANDLTRMQVQTSVDEADIGKVKEGQRVEFTVDAYPDSEFEGTVSQVRLQPVTTNNVVTYTVILNAPNPQLKLMPGMTASATIYVEEKDSTLILSGKAVRFTPSTAYLEHTRKGRRNQGTGYNLAGGSVAGQPGSGSHNFQEGESQGSLGPRNGTVRTGENSGSKTVWVENDKNELHPVHVITGIDNGTNIEILSGLKEGDEIVISMSGGSNKYASGQGRNEPARRPFFF